jgi:alpha-1,2-mannosyltransferase
MRLKRTSTKKRIVLLAFVLITLASGLYFARKSGTDPDAYSNDFNVYYHAAREVIGGRDPYQHSLGDWTPYIYPPLLAEIIVPLAFLPLPVAAYVWFLVGAGSIVAAAWISARLATDSEGTFVLEQSASALASRRAAIAVCAAIVVLRFVLDTFNLGQVNALVLVLAVAHVHLYARDRKALSAVALVIAVSIKLTPALLLLYHLAKLRLRFVALCVALLVAVTAISLLPFGHHGAEVLQTFWNRTVKNEQGYDFGYSGNQSLRGAIARLTGETNEAHPDGREPNRPDDPTTLLVSMVLLAIAAFAAVRARTELAAAAPLFCCMVLLSPLSWKAHYVILIPPVAYLISRAKVLKRGGLLIASTLVAAFTLFNMTSPRVIGLAAAEWADYHALVFAGALIIFIACAAITLARPNERNLRKQTSEPG